jgi:two-component system chemotaxis sensor kinase CheA
MDLSPDITAEDLQAFLQEAGEHLQLLDEDIVRLEREQANPDLVQEIFRAAHTLKGSSAMLGHARMAQLAHAMESVLDRVRKGALAVTTEVVDALLHSLDALTVLKEELVSPGEAELDIGRILAELEGVLGADTVAGPETAASGENVSLELTAEQQAELAEWIGADHRALRVRAMLSQDTSWAAVRCYQVLDALRNAGTVVASVPSAEDVEAERAGLVIEAAIVTELDADEVRRLVLDVSEVRSVEISEFEFAEQTAPMAEQREASLTDGDATLEGLPQDRKARMSQTVRIDVERLDAIMNLIGELVIDRTRIAQIGKMLEVRYREDDVVKALGNAASHAEKIVDELQEVAMKLRMLPIGTVFNSFPRMMRDLAQRMDKQVVFVVEGQDTEIDRTVIDRIRDPLVHLLRNSLDHGLESPSERQAAGKPEQGTVQLKAFHEQGHIVITVEDDGRGIDAQRLRKSAVAKGLISAEAASRMTEAETLELIFMPGASTAAATTEISGRGVGMDIVRSNVAAINGSISVDTALGKGTKITLRLPLTLATLRALLVSVGGTTYAIPLIYVLEAVAMEAGDIHTVGGREVIRLRGEVIPLLHLRSVLNMREAERTQAGQKCVVVARIGDKLVGLAVDSLIELQEIVVKPLGAYIGEVEGVAGASIIGDGRVVLILDAPTLLTLAGRPRRAVRDREYAIS